MAWVIGYFSVAAGLICVGAVSLLVLTPPGAIVALLLGGTGPFGAVLGVLLIAPIWFWLGFRFVLPVVLRLISIDGRPALFALDKYNPKLVAQIVGGGLNTIRADIISLGRRLGLKRNA